MKIVFSFVFHAVSCRLVRFTKFIENNEADVMSCALIYKCLLDVTEEAIKTFKVAFAVGLLLDIPRIIIATYSILAEMRGDDARGLLFSSFAVSSLIGSIHTLILLLLPSYFAGQLVSDYRRLKTTLHNELLQETDSLRCRDLKYFIRYTEARPFRFLVCEIVPVDWTLPVLVLHVIATYLIVVLQFTHLV